MGPYFHSGVLLIPRVYCGPLLNAWTDMDDCILAVYREHPRIVPEQWRFHLAPTAIPVRALPSELNYPAHVLVHPAARSEIGPVILHYHMNISPDGFLTRSRNKELNSDLHAFNLRRSAALGIVYTRLPHLPLRVRVRRALL